MANSDAANSPAPWHAAFPAPKNQDPETIFQTEVFDWLLERKMVGRKSFVLVDLRKNDHQGGTIYSSINLPAQSLYPSIPFLYSMFKDAGIMDVIWYCGSSFGRGTRAAGWFDDYIKSKGDEQMKSLTLFDGIEGWVSAGPKYVEMMDGYEKSFWDKA